MEIRKLLALCYVSMCQLRPIYRIGIIVFPIASALMNFHMNSLVASKEAGVILCILYKFAFDYLNLFIIQTHMKSKVMDLANDLIYDLQLAKLKCGIVLPAPLLTQYNEVLTEKQRLKEFLFFIPTGWNAFINFAISIYFIRSQAMFMTLYCIAVTWVLINKPILSSDKVKDKDRTKITDIKESSLVKLKLSMGKHLSREKEDAKIIMNEYVILLTNTVVAAVALTNNNTSHYYSLSRMSMLFYGLAGSIKSTEHYTYYEKFIQLLKTLNDHKLVTENETITEINEVRFVNTSFGYHAEVNTAPVPRITNLSFTFHAGNLYYLEAPNGVGKSTILRMFTSNLISGEIYFDNTNRKDLTFECIMAKIFYIPQASEFAPQFSVDTVKECVDQNEALARKLGVDSTKSTSAMSGGQKKRFQICAALNSSAPIILMDETLSELSTEETPDVPEGGGWLMRTINTIIEYKRDRIIVLVGHGLNNKIPPTAIKIAHIVL